MSKDNSNIYEVLREKINLKEYCENELGMNFRESGNSYRARPETGGHDAFAIWKDNPFIWHDFAQNTHGDIVELCAMMNHNGNKREALKELAEKFLTESEREKYLAGLNKWLKERDAEQETVKLAQSVFHSGQYEQIQHWPEYLHNRGLNDDDIKRLRLGFDSITFGLMIPRYDYDGKTVITHKVRRMPDKDGNEDESKSKYKEATGNSFVHEIPIGLQTIKRPGIFIITEGDFDYFMFEKIGYACIGKIQTIKQWTEILNLIEEREAVYLAYDNDKDGKDFTYDAAKRLFQRNIKFFVMNLPENCKDVNEFVINGGNISDLIANATDGLEYLALTFKPKEQDTKADKRKKEKELKAFLTRCYTKKGIDKADVQKLISDLKNLGYDSDWLNEIKKQAEKGESESEIVDAILEKFDMLYNERTGFYVYDKDKGLWTQNDDTLIKKNVKEHLGATATAKKLHAVTEHIKVAVADRMQIIKEKFNKMPVFGFKNITLHFNAKKEDGLLRDFEITDYLTHRVSYEYNAEAKCEEWSKAVKTIFANDDRRILCFQEFCGYILLNHCKYQKALILRDKSGNGCNGKSTLLNVLKSVIGAENCTSLQPYQFEDKFSIIHLKDSKLNICSDCNNNMQGENSNLKIAINGETLNGCFKNKDFIDFNPVAKIIFAVNGDFSVKNLNGAFERRFLLIECPVQFIDDGEQDLYHVLKDRNIEKKLMNEKAGIFNWILAGAKRLEKNGGKFTKTDEQAELDKVFRTENKAESVNNFVDAMIENKFEWIGRTFKMTDVYAEYVKFCADSEIEKENISSNRTFFREFETRLKNKEISFRRYRPHGDKENYIF